MNSRDYWQKREEEQLKHYIKDEAEYDRQIKQIYANMLDSCQEQIDSFYGRYASKEGISLAEAKKRVSKLNIAAYERKAKRYVREKNFSKQANEEMRIYNAVMKINRLEMLKANIGLELISGHNELEKFMEGVLQGRTMEELERQAGILGKTIRNNAKTAHAIVNGSFHNGTFSDRIWQYQDLMREDLGRLLQTGLIQGKNPRAIAKDLKKYWYGADPRTGGGATYCMERLMRTELARVQTEAQKQSFDRNGFDEYMFISNENGNTCEMCAKLDGKHFKVKDMMPGLNAPPCHPNCRCSTAAYVDDEEYEAWLDYLDKGGTTKEWESSGKAAWEKKFSLFQAQDVKISEKSGKNSYSVNRQLVNSKSYHDKFDKLPISKTAAQSAYYQAKTILEHRDGTHFEDVSVLDSRTGKFIVKNDTYEVPFKSAMTEKQYKQVLDHKGTVVLIHNHAEGTRFSKADIFTAFQTKNVEMSIAIGHDGSVHCLYGINRNVDIEKIYNSAYNIAMEKYNNKDLAIIKGTDALYEAGVFKYSVW